MTSLVILLLLVLPCLSAWPSARLPATRTPLPKNVQQLRGHGATNTFHTGSLTLKSCLTDNEYGITDLYCINITVPVDYSAPASGTLDILFIVHLAENQPKSQTKRNAMFIPFGGPGSVSHIYAPDVCSGFSGLQFYKDFDLLFVEQRGMGWSCGIWCVNAYQTLIAFPFDPAKPDLWATEIAAFPQACLAEMSEVPHSVDGPCLSSHTTLSPIEQRAFVMQHLGTKPAAMDIEKFRSKTGYDKIWLNGGSYGSSPAQVYAALYPSHVSGMILDSPINNMEFIGIQDTNLFKTRQNLLTRIFGMCSQNSECWPNLHGTTAARIISAAFDVNGKWPKTVQLPLEDGSGFLAVPVQRYHVENVMMNWLGTPDYTGDVVRALIAASRGDYLPVVRMFYTSAGLDPVTGFVPDVNAVIDSDSEYCVIPPIYGADFLVLPEGTAVPSAGVSVHDRALKYANWGKNITKLPMGTQYTADICGGPAGNPVKMPAYSLVEQNKTVPTPYFHKYPIIISGPSLDGFCSDIDAEALLQHYKLGGPTVRVVLNDGPHTIFGTGVDPSFDCTNEMIQRFLYLNGTLGNTPSGTTMACNYEIPFNNYYANAPAHGPSSHADALRYTDPEMISLAEFRMGATSGAGCTHGGTVAWESSEDGSYYTFTLTDCSFFNNYSVTGTGTFLMNNTLEYAYGGDVSFTNAKVVSAAGVSKCFNYYRTAEQNPIVHSTQVRCK